MKITMEQIKNFRNATGYKLCDCKEALEKTNGNETKAKEYIQSKWKEKIQNW